jgi:hypothetical protein
MKPDILIQEIAKKNLSPQETLKELSALPFGKFMLIGKLADGNWSSFFSNLDIEEASYAAMHAHMIVTNQHGLQMHRPNADTTVKTSTPPPSQI